jgi:hypothetical protein
MRGKLEEWITNPDFSPSPDRIGDYSLAVDGRGVTRRSFFLKIRIEFP